MIDIDKLLNAPRSKQIKYILGAVVATALLAAVHQLSSTFTSRLVTSDHEIPSSKTQATSEKQSVPTLVPQKPPATSTQAVPKPMEVKPSDVSSTNPAPTAPVSVVEPMLTGPCKELAIPKSPANASNSLERVCAVAACGSAPADAPIYSIHEWIQIASRLSPTCQLADREAVSEYETFSKLFTILDKSQPTTTHTGDKTICIQVSKDLQQDLENLRTKTQVNDAAIRTCGSKVQNSISSDVQAMVNAVRAN